MSRPVPPPRSGSQANLQPYDVTLGIDPVSGNAVTAANKYAENNGLGKHFPPVLSRKKAKAQHVANPRFNCVPSL